MNENLSFIQISKYILNTMSILVPIVAFFFIGLKGFLWDVSMIAVIILMLIRPINDIFSSLEFYKLMPLRKNLGILSAMVVVSYGVIHYFNMGFSEFFSTYFSLAYWTFSGNLFWAHLGELTGFILLITSNTFSVRLLKRNWKRVQRLSYLYFFCGSWYVFSSFGKTYALIALIIVFEVSVFAYFKKRIDKRLEMGDDGEEIESKPQVETASPVVLN